jgi:hypothetical protein
MEAQKQLLDTRPARTDLTDRECAKLIGACLGGLVEMADVEAVRRAVIWWAVTDAAWEGFQLMKDQLVARAAQGQDWLPSSDVKKG